MSACVYYRRKLCANPNLCQYKLMANDGKVRCQREGELGALNITSERIRTTP